MNFREILLINCLSTLILSTDFEHLDFTSSSLTTWVSISPDITAALDVAIAGLVPVVLVLPAVPVVPVVHVPVVPKVPVLPAAPVVLVVARVVPVVLVIPVLHVFGSSHISYSNKSGRLLLHEKGIPDEQFSFFRFGDANHGCLTVC